MKNEPAPHQKERAAEAPDAAGEANRLINFLHETRSREETRRAAHGASLPPEQAAILARIFYEWETRKEDEWLGKATAFCVRPHNEKDPQAKESRRLVAEEIWWLLATRNYHNYPVPSPEEISSAQTLLERNLLPRDAQAADMALRFYFAPGVWHDLIAALLHENAFDETLMGNEGMRYFPSQDPELLKNLSTYLHQQASQNPGPWNIEKFGDFLHLCEEMGEDAAAELFHDPQFVAHVLAEPEFFTQWVWSSYVFPKSFREIVRAHKTKIIETYGRSLLAGSNLYPDLIKELLEDETMRNLFLARHPRAIGHYGAGYYQETFNSLAARGLLPNQEIVEFKKVKANMPTLLQGAAIYLEDFSGSPEKEALLARGYNLQCGEISKDNGTALWEIVKDRFGFIPDANAAITFGMEVEPSIIPPQKIKKEEPETEQEIEEEIWGTAPALKKIPHTINEMLEMRSFAVSEPESLTALFHAYRDVLDERYPQGEKSYGAIRGTLHLNVGIARSSAAEVSFLLPRIGRAAGAAILASTPISKIIADTTFRGGFTGTLSKYVLFDGTALPHMHHDLAPMKKDHEWQAFRLEWKGFSIPADDQYFSRTADSLELFARLAKNPAAFAHFTLQPEGERTMKEIVTLAIQAWNNETHLHALTGGRPFDEYGGLVRSLVEKLRDKKSKISEELTLLQKTEIAALDSRRKGVEGELREKERQLGRKVSEDLMHRYSRGENLAAVLKNLGLKTLWDDVQDTKQALKEHDTNPSYAARRDLQKTVGSIDLAQTEAREALLTVKKLQLSIQTARKKTEALQEILFLDFKNAASRALQDTA